MKRLFSKKQDNQDFSHFFGEQKETRKERLLKECQKNNVSIYVDDVSEPSSGIYAELRGVASEAELERRLDVRKAVRQSNYANIIAVISFVISVIALWK
jgi:hypothetical protein